MKAGSKVGLVAGFLAVGAAAWAFRDYTSWLALGPGGLPANAGGWFSMTRYRLMATDQLNVAPLLAAGNAAEDVRAWTKTRQRPGRRPAVSPYPIPHRQLDQLPDEAVRAALVRLFDRTVAKHGERVEYALSHFEKRHPAITLKASARTARDSSAGEIAHIHPSDNSMHMILSASDAVAAIEMGWAQRHGLAGIAGGLPATYVMVYAPRNEGDLLVVAELVEAAISYAMQAADQGSFD